MTSPNHGGGSKNLGNFVARQVKRICLSSGAVTPARFHTRASLLSRLWSRSMPGLFSRVAGSSALEYREQHDDGEVQEGSSVSATGDSAESEARSLRKFHRAMGGKGWRRKHGWGAADSDAPQFALEDYDGVTVGPGGRVDQIRLRDNNLSATVFLTHPEHFPRLNRWSYLSGLRSLTVLDLSNNSQRGRFPKCIAGLVTLEELDLSHNKFFGTISSSRVHQLPSLRRLRLNNNDLTGFIPKQIKHMGNLELLDCSNNDISDLLPAWACVGAVHANANDPYPREMYVFIMDAPPKLMEGVSGPARTAQARLRADEWIRWHLVQEHQPPHAMHLGEVQVKMVALPQHDKARVRFCIKSGGGETHTIEFGKERMLPRAVFGAVNDATAVDEFPHVVVALNVGHTADMAADSQASAPFLLRRRTSFSIGDSALFQGAWEEVVQRRNSCNTKIKAPLAFLCFGVAFFGTPLLLINLRSIWLYILPLLCLSGFLGVLLSISIVCNMWVTYVRAAPSCPTKIGRFIVWVLAVVCWGTFGIYVNGFILNMVVIFHVLFLPIDLLLARCGVRAATAMWPFYRMLGFQGCKAPTLTVTVELTNGGLEQV